MFMSFPVKTVPGWWRVCFWASTIPGALLATFMEFCAESPHWLSKRGQIGEAEARFERLLGFFHVKSAMAELSRSDKGDDVESIRFSDLLSGHYFRGSVVAMTLRDKLGRKLLLMGSFPDMAASMGLQATAASFPDSWSLYLSVGGILFIRVCTVAYYSIADSFVRSDR